MGEPPKQAEGVGCFGYRAVIGKHHPLLAQGVGVQAPVVGQRRGVGDAFLQSGPIVLLVLPNEAWQFDTEMLRQIS